jgi:hypothetical protein
MKDGCSMVIISTKYMSTRVRPLHSFDHQLIIGTPKTSLNTNTPITTFVAKYPDVTKKTPTLKTTTKSLTNNKLHFKKTHEAQF